MLYLHQMPLCISSYHQFNYNIFNIFFFLFTNYVRIIGLQFLIYNFLFLISDKALTNKLLFFFIFKITKKSAGLADTFYLYLFSFSLSSSLAFSSILSTETVSITPPLAILTIWKMYSPSLTITPTSASSAFLIRRPAT